MKGLPLVLLPIIASLPSTIQNPSGVILLQPGYDSLRDPLKATPSDSALLTFSAASVLVETIPDELKADLSRDDVSEWVANLLKNSGIKVLTLNEKRSVFSANSKMISGNEIGYLRASDRLRSEVYANIIAIKADDGLTSYSVSIEVIRGVFIDPGYFISATVWDREMIGVFGSAINAKATIKENVTTLMKTLETDIIKARAAKK